jgi:hypothetical protein
MSLALRSFPSERNVGWCKGVVCVAYVAEFIDGGLRRMGYGQLDNHVTLFNKI